MLLLHNHLDVRKNYVYNFFGVPLNNFKSKFVALLSLPVWHFLCFFSVISSVEISQNLLFSAALSERNFVVFHIRPCKVYELIIEIE